MPVSVLDANERNGHPVDWFTAAADIDQLFICGLCSTPTKRFVVNKPVEVKGCGHLYCSNCIIRYWSEMKQMPLEQISCPHPTCCQVIPAETTEDSFHTTRFVQRQVEALPITCPNRCGVKGLVLGYNEETLRKHIRVDCDRELVACQLCDDQTIYRCGLFHHQTHVCPMRMVTCAQCSRTMSAEQLAKHKDNEVGCADYQYCPNGCYCCTEEGSNFVKYVASLEHFSPADTNAVVGMRSIIHKNALAAHLDNCPLQRRPCTLKCPATLLMSESDKHMSESCPNRPWTCPVCLMDFKHCEVDSHQDNEVDCIFSTKCVNECKCALTGNDSLSIATANSRFVTPQVALVQNLRVVDTIILKSHEHQHQSQYCPLQLIPCRVCPEKVHRHAMTKHLEQNVVDHLLTLVERIAVLEEQK